MNKRTSLPGRLAVAIAAGILIGVASTHAAETRTFDIPPGELSAALKSLAQETGLELIYQPAQLRGVRTSGVKGSFSPQEAIDALLKGTLLTTKTDASGAILISAEPAAPVAEEWAPGTSRLADGGQSLQSGPVAAQESGNAGAQTPGSSADEIDEILVTAQKREERLRDVPMSISVLSGDDLDKSTSTSLVDVLRNVSGVSILTSHVGGGSQFPIRGVVSGGSVFAGASPTAYYLDSVPFGFSKSAIGPDPDVYDLQRVEVLRGPQGTLYGASALNGVVRILTHRADPTKFAAKARSAISSTKGGGTNYRADAALNVPIVEDKLAARAVVGYQDLSGWIDGPVRKDINDAERLNARLRIDATPTDRLSLGALVWHSRSEYGAPSGANDLGVRRTTLDEPIWTDYDVYGINASYDFESLVLTSSTSYIDYENHWNLDAVAASGLFLYDGRLPAETFSQEVTLASASEGPWRWTAGGIYRDSKDMLSYFIANSSRAQSMDRRKTESFAIFGEVTRLFLDGRFELTGGLRYFEDRLAQTEISRANGATNPPLSDKSGTFTATTPRVVATWHPTQQMTAYASYGQGFRSGVFQAPGVLIVDASLPDARPDELRNYEVGTKASAFDGRLNFEAAAFYIDWQDIQQSVQIFSPVVRTTVSGLINGSSASGAGVEFSVTAEPVQSLSLGVNFSWNDLTYDTPVTSATTTGALVLYGKGDRIGLSPEYTAGGSLDYAFPAGALNGAISMGVNYTSAESHAEIASGRVIRVASDSVLTVRSAVSLSSDKGWTATLFAENLTNEESSPLRLATDYWAARIRPQTIGLQFEYRYK